MNGSVVRDIRRLDPRTVRWTRSRTRPSRWALSPKDFIAAGLKEAVDTVNRSLSIAEKTASACIDWVEFAAFEREALAATGQRAVADPCLRNAIETRSGQEARMFELRAVVSLCRILDGSDRRAALLNILVLVPDLFGDTPTAPDVQEAHTFMKGQTDG